ncbi:MAG: hypothetical protein ACP5SG_06025, partial [Dissulfurimicrobium sp.]
DDAFIDGDIIPISPRVSGLDPHDFQARLDGAEAALEAAKAANRARNISVELTRITATAELNEAKDNVESARAAVQEAKARLALCEAALAQAKAEAESARGRYRLDATNLKRYREMAKTKTVSLQDLDRAVAAEQMSAADLRAAEKKVDKSICS